jgi:hypothetical protein
LVAFAAACDSATAPTSITKVPNGIWGGEHAGLTVKDSGALFDVDCAHGSVEKPMSVDRSGRFDVPGTFVQEHGGPSAGDSHPARYVGSTDGRRMSLTVQLTDSNETVGPFTLTLRQSPQITKCMLV